MSTFHIVSYFKSFHISHASGRTLATSQQISAIGWNVTQSAQQKQSTKETLRAGKSLDKVAILRDVFVTCIWSAYRTRFKVQKWMWFLWECPMWYVVLEMLSRENFTRATRKRWRQHPLQRSGIQLNNNTICFYCSRGEETKGVSVEAWGTSSKIDIARCNELHWTQ